MSFNHHTVSVIIPAHNESLSIGAVVNAINEQQIGEHQLVDHIIVCDNASKDNTAQIAKKAGALVVSEPSKGYGYACLCALKALDNLSIDKKSPHFIVFVDGDHSVDAREIIKLLKPLTKHYDLAVGTRENTALQQGALSRHQRFGNQLASLMIRALWQHKVTDLGPFRAITSTALKSLNMQDQRFGWTVEMQVKAIQKKLNYVEVPVSTRRRIGVSKISGTVSGTIGAGYGIFSKIFSLYLGQLFSCRSQIKPNSSQ